MKAGREEGVTLIELIIVMAVILFVMMAATRLLSAMLTQFKQQTKIAETNIEGVVGLQVLRRDLFSAGFGLPVPMDETDTTMTISYDEAATGTDQYSFNDAGNKYPRAVIGTQPSFGTINGSDYLVVKSSAVAEHRVAGKSHYIGGSGVPSVVEPAGSDENLRDEDLVVVMQPNLKRRAALKTDSTNSSNWYTTFDDVDNFKPTDTKRLYVIYGIDPGTSLRAPFNRADYYISGAAGRPERCAAGTGVLVKAVMQQSDGSFGVIFPLMDCVADMQVVFGRDTDDEDGVDTWVNSTDGLDAFAIKQEVGEAQVYILAQEGQKDPNYVHPSSTIHVGPPGFGRDFDLSAITDWEQYRWRVYAVSVAPPMLMTKNRL